MPYRRLPNTDQARLRAMRRSLEMAKKLIPSELAFSQSNYRILMNMLPQFEHYILLEKEAYQNQVKSSKEYNELLRKTRLYISHFIQVLNFAVIRGELKQDVRLLFQLDDTKLPSLSTEQELLEWGKRIIEIEEKRIAKGETPIMNPKIAIVKLWYNKFSDFYRKYKGLQEITNKAIEKVALVRPEVDKLIVSIWNEVESKLKNFQPELKRAKASEYGLVYVFRKTEKEKYEKVAS